MEMEWDDLKFGTKFEFQVAGEDVQELINEANEDERADLQIEIYKLVEAREKNPKIVMSEFDWRGHRIMLYVHPEPSPNGSYNFMIYEKQFFEEIRKQLSKELKDDST
jgi:hypothetical protein